jgi:hypothetical protein
MLDIQLGVIIDEGGENFVLLNVLTFEDEDLIDYSANESGDVNGVWVWFHPSRGLKEEFIPIGIH